MIGLVRNEWKKVFLPVLLTTVLLAIAMSVLSCTIYQNYVLHYDLEAWEVGTELFSLLYPLFVVVPLCWNLYYERKNNLLLIVLIIAISIRFAWRGQLPHIQLSHRGIAGYYFHALIFVLFPSPLKFTADKIV